MSVSKIMFSTLLAMTVASPLFAKGDGPQCSCPQMPTPTCKPETPPPDENPQGTPTFPPTTSDTSGPHPQMPQPTHQTQASPPSSFGTLNGGISYLPVKELVRTAKPIPYGLSFLDEMRGHVEEGIVLATLMVEKTQDDDLRSFGQGMQKNLSQELSKISSWRSHWYPSASEFKNFSLGMKMERVGSLTGVEKELSLLDSLIHHHAGSLSLKSAFMKKRNYHRLTNLVRSIDLQESRELKQLRKWRNAFASQK